MKKKQLTKSEINLKLLNKYKTNLDDINYDALKTFKDILKISQIQGKMENVNIKFGTSLSFLSLLF